ncbi:MAG TPA: hypothetical protein VM074_02490 [Solimonas sp.]|nr:hypothetical protein [Solimonas sp.]
MRMPSRIATAAPCWLALFLLAACSPGREEPASGASKAAGDAVYEGPVPRAVCGAGSVPETDIQGRVSIEDRESGRSQQGYRCNLELVGQYQGQGTTWVSQSYDHCAYHSQTFSAARGETPGVSVVDVSDPAHPVLVERLNSPAFRGGTWESLKVNVERGLLAGVFVGSGDGVAFFDVYDIKTDCAHPTLLSSIGGSEATIPANAVGHEGGWSPDGRTYWSTSLWGGSITAIDVTDPTLPHIIYTGYTSPANHGFELSQDGNRLYMGNAIPEGLIIFDVSDIQSRTPAPQIRELGSVTWTDGSLGQHTIPVTWNGKPYLFYVDESGAGAARIIDIADEMAPRVISKLKLEIHMPENAELRTNDSANNGLFGYEGHYCEVDRRTDPTALACGYFQSGIRVFDVRDPMQPREVAYYNPPAQVGKAAELTGSEHAGGGANLTTDWCSSPPRFVGDDQLWVTCQDNGFMVLKFTNSAYPIAAAPAPAPVTPPPVVAPPPVVTVDADRSQFGGALGGGLLFWLMAALGLRPSIRTLASLARLLGMSGRY